MTVFVAYLVFLPFAAICFARLPVRTAILFVLIGGWWLLPVAQYGTLPRGDDFPWWITGIALPSDMLVTKAWIPPLVALTGAAIRDPAALRAWRPEAIDLLMAGWCVWPLIDGFGIADPASPLAAAYVTGSWGFSWLIGRVWFSGEQGGIALVRGLAVSGLAALPIAVIEGLHPPVLYQRLYGAHPFVLDGITRYVGYRPLGFTEDGNGYGIWVSLVAFASIWLARRERHEADGRRWLALAVVNTAITIASQSVGGILLLFLGLGLLVLWRRPIFLPMMAGVAGLALIVAIVHFSGIIPIQSIGHSPTGERVIAAMRSTGRGSFLWRISQDTKTLSVIAANPMMGTAQWDWWRPFHTRPWGQALLLLGQFGAVGLILAWGALLSACTVAFHRLRTWGMRLDGDASLPLAIIVVLVLVDATMNAFFFFPALVAAGSIAAWPQRRRRKR